MNAFTIMVGVALTVLAFVAVLLAIQYMTEVAYYRIVKRSRRKNSRGEKRNG